MSTPAEIDAAARADLNGRATEAAMTPREQAEAAWTPGCGHTVDELEALIRADRGLPAIDRQDGAA